MTATTADNEPDPDTDLDEGAGTGFTRRPAQSTGSKYNPMQYLRKRGRESKEKKALDKGYIRWYLVGESVSKPKYIKPERKEGGGIPEFEYEGNTYLFPEHQMLPDAEDGVWTVMHKRGQAEPIDLQTGNDDSIDAHVLNKYLTQRVTAGDPNGLGLIPSDWDSMDIMRYGLLAVVGLFIAMEFLG